MARAPRPAANTAAMPTSPTPQAEELPEPAVALISAITLLVRVTERLG